MAKPKEPPTSLQKWRRRAIWFGMILALICQALPPKYHAVCKAVSHACTGGL